MVYHPLKRLEEANMPAFMKGIWAEAKIINVIERYKGGIE